MGIYVLLHGAYQGGWIWQPLAERLRREGHRVYAPSLDGCAERAHALRPGITTEAHGEEIAALLHYEDLNEVVLVGTSSGGMVLCKAAELARDRIARIVFADALALLDGEKLRDIVARPSAVTTDLATGPTREDAAGRLFADLDPELRDWTVERITLHPIACMTSPVRLPSFWQQQWDATVIRCLRAANPPEAHQRRAAEKLKAKYFELDTGHYPMLSETEALARLLTQH